MFTIHQPLIRILEKKVEKIFCYDLHNCAQRVLFTMTERKLHLLVLVPCSKWMHYLWGMHYNTVINWQMLGCRNSDWSAGILNCKLWIILCWFSHWKCTKTNDWVGSLQGQQINRVWIAEQYFTVSCYRLKIQRDNNFSLASKW